MFCFIIPINHIKSFKLCVQLKRTLHTATLIFITNIFDNDHENSSSFSNFSQAHSSFCWPQLTDRPSGQLLRVHRSFLNERSLRWMVDLGVVNVVGPPSAKNPISYYVLNITLQNIPSTDLSYPVYRKPSSPFGLKVYSYKNSKVRF